VTCADIGEEEALRLIASAELRSEHPLAAAVVEHARAKGIELSEPSSFEALAGSGVHAVVDGHDVWVGKAALARAMALPVLATGCSAHHQSQGRTTLVATIDGQPGAVLAVADVAKAAAAEAIKEIRALGARTLLVSGDARGTVESDREAARHR